MEVGRLGQETCYGHDEVQHYADPGGEVVDPALLV